MFDSKNKRIKHKDGRSKRLKAHHFKR